MTPVLVSGTLFRAPEQRTSKAGKPFVMATIRTKDGDNSQWWKGLAFSENIQKELLRVTPDDALAVQGSLKACEKDGETKVSLSVVADHVLPLRQPRRKPADGEGRQASTQAQPAAAFDETIPF